MRISTGYQYTSWTQNIDATTQNLYNLEEQLSSGKKISKPSDDPYGTTQSLNMTSLSSALTQYNSNLNTAKSYLTAADSGLNDASNLTQQAYSLAVEAASSTTDQTGRAAIVDQVTQMESSLLSIANSRGPNGDYIFGGQKTSSPPFTLTGNTLTYNGDANSMNVSAGPNQTVCMNVPGGGVFDKLYSQLEQFKTDLQGGGTGTISTIDIQNLQTMNQQLSQIQGDVGARLQNVATWTNQNTLRITELTADISNYTDVNYAQVATQYQAAQIAYQAALEVTASAQKFSLMNYIQ